MLIRSLEVGGAQRQLVELVRALDRDHFSITVATFYDGRAADGSWATPRAPMNWLWSYGVPTGARRTSQEGSDQRGELRSQLEKLKNVRVISLRKKGRWDILPFLWRLWKLLYSARPHIVYGSMGVANELSLLVGRVVGAKVVWSLRASNVDFSHYDWASGVVFRIGAWLSHFPDLIIVNSYAGKKHHIAHGYATRRMAVIPNGINVDMFRPDCAAGERVRLEWQIGSNGSVVGLVGRLDPIKDHPTFLRAAALLAERRSEVRFVCVGDGPAGYKGELRILASQLGLDDRLIWAGVRSDMQAVYNAFDTVCSSSYGEGLPNAIAEAMACGVPCIVTDVGDSARLVGNRAQVVPANNPVLMADAIERLLSLPSEERATLGKQGRQRIVSEYSVQKLATKTGEALLTIL